MKFSVMLVLFFVLVALFVPSLGQPTVKHNEGGSGQCSKSHSLVKALDANLFDIRGVVSRIQDRQEQSESRISHIQQATEEQKQKSSEIITVLSQIQTGVTTEAFETYKQQQEARISELEQKIHYANPCFLKSEKSTNPSQSFSDWDFLYRSGYAKATKFRYNLKNRAGFGTYIGCFGMHYGSVAAPCHGEDGDVQSITLASDEFIIGITGRSGTVIDKLSIKTNKRTYGPYGDGGGSAFTIEPRGSRLAYMEGTTNGYLTSLKPVFYSPQTVFLPSGQPVCS